MGRGISILMYHQIGRFQRISAKMKAHKSTYCKAGQFRIQMLYLRLFGYKTLNFDEVVLCIRGDMHPPPCSVAVTFDDGYENFYEFAYPVLKKYGIPSIVYVLSGYLGKDASWFSKDGRPCPPLMESRRIKEISAGNGNVLIGSHGIRHLRLGEINDISIVEREVSESKTCLEAVIGSEIRHFCYPYGSYNQKTMDAVREAGYISAVSCVRGTAKQGDDLLQLPRKAISYGDSLAGFIWKLHAKNKRKTGEI